MARTRRHERLHPRPKHKRKGDKAKDEAAKDEAAKDKGSATDQVKETTTTGECPVITMNPTAAQMSVPPDEAANDLSVYSTGPGEAVMYHYERQGQYAEEYASQQAQQSAVPASVNVSGPGQG